MNGSFDFSLRVEGVDVDHERALWACFEIDCSGRSGSGNRGVCWSSVGSDVFLGPKFLIGPFTESKRVTVAYLRCILGRSSI